MKEEISSEERFWQGLFQLTDYMRETLARQHGVSDDWNLTIQQSRLLRAVLYLTRIQYPDGIMLKTAAAALGVTPAAVCGMVDNLVRRGLLTRVRCANNRRAVRITLSEFSRKKIQEVNVLFSGMASSLKNEIGESEFIRLIGGIEKLNAGLPDLYADPEPETKKS